MSPRAVALAALWILLPACGAARTEGDDSVHHPVVAAGAPDSAFGYQIVVHTELAAPSSSEAARVGVRGGAVDYRGELVACEGDALYVALNLKEGEDTPGPSGAPRGPYRRVTLREVRQVELVDSVREVLITWTILGTLSTASNGYWAIASGSAFALTGTVSAVASSQRTPEPVCPALAKYARFPAGMPDRMKRFFDNAGMAPQFSRPDRAPTPMTPDAAPSPFAAPPPGWP